MYTNIYQNSYIVALITFIVLSVIFYFLQIGSKTEIVNGKIVKKFSWKYPLAISLIMWIFWHFYMFPPESNDDKDYKHSSVRSDKLADQKIIMNPWI